MQYFVTGATGFIGKRLVKKLLARKGTVVHFLIRHQSAEKVAALHAYWGLDDAKSQASAQAVPGDLTQKKLGLSTEAIKALKGNIDHFYHLAAVYDLDADEESQIAVNIEGTRNTVELAKAIDAAHFHHVSSIAAAGLYEGVFREDMFDEAENYEHPYFMTKHESEKIVRTECKVPWSVYRPAMVVGDSQTGEMDKIDGPYYFFKLIQRMRQLLPPWMPAIGLEGGRINIVPVDYVVDALDAIRHQQAVLPLGGPVGVPCGGCSGHLQQSGACAQNEFVRQCCAPGIYSAKCDQGTDGAGARAPCACGSDERPWRTRRPIYVHQLPHPL
jgi:thioester reductase-like protein